MSSMSKILMAAIAVTTVTAAAPAFADSERHEEHKAQHELRKYDWNQEKGLYSKHWHKANSSQQAVYDAEMREQWLAYNHGKWDGAYNWDTYNNPAFIEYLHTNRPTLLQKVRYDLGF